MQTYPHSDIQVHPHDLVWFLVGPHHLPKTTTPPWVLESLQEAPVAVVRRASQDGRQIPIGIRGVSRDQRFAAAIPVSSVVRGIPPERLLSERCEPRRSRYAEIPALRAFQIVLERWGRMEHVWGPTGSVGFELGTGCEVVTPKSDLDLIIRVPNKISRDDAKRMLAELSEIGASVDVQMETPDGAIAMKEYCSTEQGRKILLRTMNGPILVLDPWNTNRGEQR
ncbi:MAG: malonate decarboxylase holo-ACP synthase [Negativicutes bacterium]|nr:malonate decarboxylase holo-ACP synthase [Negativicutes bacterium]